MKKRFSVIILAVLIVFVGAFALSACGGDNSTKKCTHEWGEWKVSTAVTCETDGEDKRVCKHDSTHSEVRKVDRLGHSFDTYTANGDATCSADGTKTAVCSRSGCSKSDTTADDGSKKATHAFTVETAKEATLKSVATCATKAVYFKSCADCGTISNTDVFTYGETLDHTYSDFSIATDLQHDADCLECGHRVSADHDLTENILKAATCTERGLKEFECEDCGFSKTEQISPTGHDWVPDTGLQRTTESPCTIDLKCSHCDEERPATGHNYAMTGTEPATCTEDGFKEYECTNNDCQSTYTTLISKTGHAVSDWNFEDESLKEDETCVYVSTYSGLCLNCNKTVEKTEEVEKHSLKATIQTAATCVSSGTKVFTCTTDGCDYVSDEEEYNDANAHNWTEKGTEGAVTTHECSACNATKTTISGAGAISKDDIKGADEVALENASMQLEDSLLDALTGDVTLSADKHNADELEIPDDVKQQVGDNPVYNFKLEDETGGVTEFSGKITVKIPYTLSDGEDPDCIAIWYIKDDGTLESIQAKYEGGYVIFETTHFSYYTVTRLTPAQRCSLYGHSYKEVIKEATCVADGHTKNICQRCGHTEKSDIIPAKGHKFNTDDHSDATCGQRGWTVYDCEDCEYDYTVVLPELNHEWTPISTVSATCTSAGYVEYACVNLCGKTYKTSLVQKSHDYHETIIAPTCLEGGYTEFVCGDCDDSYTGVYRRATGHIYEKTFVDPTCDEEGYTLNKCKHCDNSYKSDIIPSSHDYDLDQPTCGQGQVCTICGADGLPATDEHTMKDGVCEVCGEGCEHSFKSEVIAPTCNEKGYTLESCELCDITQKANFVAATGHSGDFICTVCDDLIVGEDFFINGLNGLLYAQEFAICVKDLTFVDVYTSNNLPVTETYTLNFAELYLAISSDNVISGFGSGTMRIESSKFNGKIDENIITAVIENNIMYLKMTQTNSRHYGYNNGQAQKIETEKNLMYMIVPLENLDSSMFGLDSASAYGQIMMMLPEIYNAYKTEILPEIDKLIKTNKSLAARIMATLAEELTTLQATAGGYVLTLDIDALASFNDVLYENSISEIIDLFAGEGAFELLVADIVTLMGATVGEAVDFAEENGLTVEEMLIAADSIASYIVGRESTINELIEQLTGTGFDLEILLADETIRSMTMVDLINTLWQMSGTGGNGSNTGEEKDIDGKEIKGEETKEEPKPEEEVPPIKEPIPELTLEYIAEYIESIGAMNVYDMLGAAFGAPKEALKEQVDFIIALIADCGTLQITTDRGGNVASVDIDVNYESEAIGFDGSVSITSDCIPSADYDGVLKEVIAKAEQLDFTTIFAATLPENAEIEYYENGNIKSASFGTNTDHYFDTLYKPTKDDGKGKDDEGVENTTEVYSVYRVESSVRNITLSENPIIMATEDCLNWYSVALAGMWEQTNSQTFVVRQFDAEGNVIFEQDFESFAKENDWVDGYPEAPEYPSFSGLNAFSTMYNVVTGEIVDGGNSMHSYIEDTSKHVEADGCYGYGERYFTCADCGKTYVQYYTNGHNKDNLITTYEFKDKEHINCEDGFTETIVCGDCGDTYSENHYKNHELLVNEYEFDLSGTGACDNHRVYMADCLCARHGFEIVTKTYYPSGDDEWGYYDERYDIREGHFNCSTCGLNVDYERLSEEKKDCIITEELMYTVYVGETKVDSYEFTSVRDYHNTQSFVDLIDGAKDCNDGVIITNRCQDCDYEYSYEISYHNQGIVETIDFKDYGAKGGYLYRRGCACGFYNYEYWQMSGEYVGYVGNDENGHFEVYSYIADGFTLRFNHYSEKVGCIRYDYKDVLIGYNDNDDTYLEKIERLPSGKGEEHQYIGSGVLKGKDCEDGVEITYTCISCNKSYVDNTYYHQNYVTEYIDLAEYGSVCGGTIYVRSCACGQNNNWYFDEEHDFDRQVIYHDNEGWLYVNICSVTDNAEGSASCPFIWGDKMVVDKDECIQHYEVLIGCDRYGNNAQKSFSYSRENHIYSEQREKIGQCYYRIYTSCEKCGDVLNEYNAYRHNYKNTVIKEATCTQFGRSTSECVDCGADYHVVDLDPTEHNWSWNGSYYKCDICGLENDNGASGNVVLEDCCDLDDNDDTYIVGYYLKNKGKNNQDYSDDYLLNITLILYGGEGIDNQVLVDDVDISRYDHNDENYVVFSKQAVIDAAKLLGYLEGSYDIRLSFVPISGDGSLDYGITFGHDHENTKIVYEFVGNENCENGVRVRTVCEDCGRDALPAETYYHHELLVISHEFDLSGTEACEQHYVKIASCYCDKVQNQILADGLECKECGLSADAIYLSEAVEGCVTTQEFNIEVCVKETVIWEYPVDRLIVDHSMKSFVELIDGAKDCNDGVIVTNRCQDCDYEYSYEISYHYSGIVETIDLKDYGAAGGYLYLENCACKRNSDYYVVSGEYKLTVEHIGEDSAEIYTFDADGFVVRYNHRKEVLSECITSMYVDILIGYNTEDGTYADSIAVSSGNSENHQLQTNTESLGNCCYRIINSCNI